MAQEIVKAVDAGLKEVNVNVIADGTFISFSLPNGSFKVLQKTIEKILVAQHDEVVRVSAKTLVGYQPTQASGPTTPPAGESNVKKGKHD